MLFAAVSAGYLGAPVAYHAPVVAHAAPIAYHAPAVVAAPAVVKTVVPAATSYANTYKVSMNAHHDFFTLSLKTTQLLP